MLDLAKLVEVTPQQAPCHPQTLADHTRHFRHHLLMVLTALLAVLAFIHLPAIPPQEHILHFQISEKTWLEDAGQLHH